MHKTSPIVPFRRRATLLFAAVAAFLPSVARAAAPTRDAVFRSIQDNVGGGANGGSGTDVDGTLLLCILGGLLGVIVVVGSISHRRKQPAATGSKSRNRHGKLVKEVMKVVPLRKRELKQLKILADNADADRDVASPLTLILCPSVMARTMQGKRLKLDRRAVTSIARKAGLQVAGR